MRHFFFASLFLSLTFFPLYGSPDSYSQSIEICEGQQPAMAIDAAGTVHLTYIAGTKLWYRTGDLSGNFGSAEEILEGPSNPSTDAWGNRLWNPRIFLDKNGAPHVAVADGNFKNRYTWYTNRIGGSWKTRVEIFDKVRDTLNRATLPHMAIDDDMTVYAGVFSVGNPTGDVRGALCRVENVATTPTVTKRAHIDNWAPQICLVDGKLWVGGRNTASAYRRFTISEHSKTTLARTGSIINASIDPTGEIAYAGVDATGEIHIAGTMRAGYHTYLTAGWYTTLSRAQAGTAPIRYRTTRENPCGGAMPIRDLVAADRVYVVYWSDATTTVHEDTAACEPTVQTYFMRVENGQKVSEMMPITDRTDGHGPSFRATPCVAAHPDGGVAAVFMECSGNMFFTTVGAGSGEMSARSGKTLPKETGLFLPPVNTGKKWILPVASVGHTHGYKELSGVQIFDNRGRLVRSIAAPSLSASGTAYEWDGRSITGAYAAPGLYYARLSGGSRDIIAIRVSR